MLKVVQTIGWSFLSPVPVDLQEGGCAVLLGQNGSGKSSLLDGIKALTGARRFGSGRSASSYRFAQRGGQSSLRNAYVFGVIDNRRRDGTVRLEGRPDEVTLILEAGPSQRRFLVLDGRKLLDINKLDEELELLREQHPRSAWMRPTDYEKRILDPLGLGPAVRRLMEIPQGEVARSLDRDSSQLISLLVELSGGQDAVQAFTDAQEALRAAKESHAESRRRLADRRARLAERELAFERSRQAVRLRGHLGVAGAQIKAVLDGNPEPEPPRASALPARETLRSTRPVAPARLYLNRLRQAGIEMKLVDGLWCVTEEARELALSLLGPGEALPLAVEGLSFVRRSGALVCGPPAAEPAATAVQEIEDLVVMEPAEEEEPAVPVMAARTRSELKAALARLDTHEIQLSALSGEDLEDLPEPAELLGEFRALARDGVPDAPEPEAELRLREMRAQVRADSEELEDRSQILAKAGEALNEARAVYDEAVWGALEKTADNFSSLCADAGMGGRIDLARGIDGPQIRILAAESPEEELKPLHGAQASLSGGWRATTVVMCVLACLSGDQALGLLLWDEPGSSLDEKRMMALGQAFRALSRRRGLMTIMTLPTTTMSEAVATFATQQIGMMRPEASQAIAPPPHIVTAPALRAAA